MKVNFDEVKKVFFRARIIELNADSLVQGERFQRYPLGANATESLFDIGDYRVMTKRRVEPETGDFNEGVYIFYKESWVWWMNVGGCYPREVIPFLDSVLIISYRAGDFWGGRGPLTIKSEILFYQHVSIKGDFQSFGGEETICELASGSFLGSCRYIGKAVIA